MSSHTARPTRLTVPAIRARKGPAAVPIVALTAYSAPMAQLVDAHADVILVGDSVGMVVHGLPSTIGVTLDMMVLHGQAVMRGATHALVVVDLPFGSYEASPQQAFASAVHLLTQTGAQAVKVEAGETMAETIRFLVERGIPVMGHVGLRPQAMHQEGGFRVKGRTADERTRVLNEARAVDEAGAFCIVVEGVHEALACAITEAVRVPTIGIGASAQCDGQILVLDDMLGLFDWTPRFVRRFGNLRTLVDQAVGDYASAVRDRSFPGAAEVYTPADPAQATPPGAPDQPEGAA